MSSTSRQKMRNKKDSKSLPSHQTAKRKGMQAKCIYPGQPRNGEKTFATVKDATKRLRELKIEVCFGKREKMEEELKERPGNRALEVT